MTVISISIQLMPLCTQHPKEPSFIANLSLQWSHFRVYPQVGPTLFTSYTTPSCPTAALQGIPLPFPGHIGMYDISARKGTKTTGVWTRPCKHVLPLTEERLRFASNTILNFLFLSTRKMKISLWSFTRKPNCSLLQRQVSRKRG